MWRGQEARKDPDAADTAVLLRETPRECPHGFGLVVTGGHCSRLPVGVPRSLCHPKPRLHHLALLQPLPRTRLNGNIPPAPDLSSEQPRAQSVTSASSRRAGGTGCGGQ